MDFSERYLAAVEEAERRRKRVLEFNSMFNKKGSASMSELEARLMEKGAGTDAGYSRKLYKLVRLSFTENKERSFFTPTEMLHELDWRGLLADFDRKEKLDLFFGALGFFLRTLELNLLKLHVKSGVFPAEFAELCVQIAQLRDMAGDVKHEILSCSDSKPAVSEADDKHLELILEALAKENKQGCQCCCDSPGNNADEDIHN